MANTRIIIYIFLYKFCKNGSSPDIILDSSGGRDKEIREESTPSTASHSSSNPEININAVLTQVSAQREYFINIHFT